MKIGRVISVNKSVSHSFSKQPVESITTIEGLGVEGDVHMGQFVKHRSRIKQNPNQINLRQIHLIHQELFDELSIRGFKILPGEIGENITTQNIDLLSLPKDTILNIGDTTSIKITGLRNPCHQLNNFQEGLMNELIFKDQNGNFIRKAGIMGIVLKSGQIRSGDPIKIKLPTKPYIKLERI